MDSENGNGAGIGVGEKELDAEIRKELLGEATLPPPALAVQLELLRNQFAIWSNTYFVARENFRVAHDSGLSSLEAQYFEEAKKMRKAALEMKRRIEQVEQALKPEKAE